MISFRSLLLPEAEAADGGDAPAADDRTFAHAVELRRLLALRGWVDPTTLLPGTLAGADRVKVLEAVSFDVQVALRDHPGQWYLRDQERRRLLTTTPASLLAEAIKARHPGDGNDPVRLALDMRRRPLPEDLGAVRTDVLKSIGSTFLWLDPAPQQDEGAGFWFRSSDPEAVKQRIAATLARRRRRDDVERMTETALFGRSAQYEALVAWATANATPVANGRFLYLSGIGGAGKSTLFAHLERRLWNDAAHPLLIHIDCDTPGFDPTDPIALDLALFSQLAIASPSAAPDLLGRTKTLAQAARSSDADYQRRSGRAGAERGRRIKAEADHRVVSYVALESVTNQKGAERSSISYDALNQLGDRTLVLLFDTAELMLARAAVDVSAEVAGTADWLTSLTGLMHGRDVRVLMAGRNPPDDEEVISLLAHVHQLAGWQVNESIVLGDLGVVDARDLLIDFGVDAAVAAKAAEVLPRTPLILKIAADVYRAGIADAAEAAAFVARLEDARIDPTIARRYLTERIVSHLASPVARPYALAAMVLPEVTEPLLEAVVLPTIDKEPPDRRRAQAVYRGLRDAGWLVRDQLARALTFHPEVRRLALALMASDPDRADLLAAVRRAARDYHARRRHAGDATYRAYYDVMLGQPLPARSKLDARLLGAAIEDLPATARTEPKPSRRLAPAGGAAASRSPADWIGYVEGTGRRDGEGDRLVKRGHVEAALDLYRQRPTRPNGRPPTFVLQALADGGYFGGGEVKIDIDAIAAEAAAEFRSGGDNLPNALRSRIYWLTRWALMTRPGPLSAAHQAVLTKASGRFSGSGPVLLFPSIAAVAEAFTPDRARIAPRSWFESHGSIESETRMFLVRHQFGESHTWRPHVDALFTLQRDWADLASLGQAQPVRQLFQAWMAELDALLRPSDGILPSQVALNEFLRRLRAPVQIEITQRTSRTDAVLLLRGMTTEFHRPLRAAMVRHALGSRAASARLLAVTQGVLDGLSIRTSEVLEAEWQRRAERDINAAFGLAIPLIDRARRLPTLCEALIGVAGRQSTGRSLALVARSFLAWDKALSGGRGSDWGKLARRLSSR